MDDNLTLNFLDGSYVSRFKTIKNQLSTWAHKCHLESFLSTAAIACHSTLAFRGNLGMTTIVKRCS